MQCPRETESLSHYGVLGMRWGVRRTPEQLRAASEKLEEKNSRYNDRVVKNKAKGANKLPKAAKLRAKANSKRAKKYGMFTSQSKADQLEFEATKLETKATKLENAHLKGNATAEKYIQKINRNRELISVFNNTADALDSGKVLAGNRFLMKYERATIDDLYR